MEKDEIIGKIKKATGLEDAEIVSLAEKKKAELSDMVSLEGALLLIAKDKGVTLEDVEIDSLETTPETQTSVSIPTGNNEVELTLDDLSKKYIKNPDVGEEIEFTTAKISKSFDIDAATKDGKKFTTALSGVDYKMVYTTTNDEEYSPSAWEVVGKLNAICRKLKKIPGIEIKVKHLKDGRVEKEGDSYEVLAKVDGTYKQLERKTSEWK